MARCGAILGSRRLRQTSPRGEIGSLRMVATNLATPELKTVRTPASRQAATRGNRWETHLIHQTRPEAHGPTSLSSARPYSSSAQWKDPLRDTGRPSRRLESRRDGPCPGDVDQLNGADPPHGTAERDARLRLGATYDDASRRRPRFSLGLRLGFGRVPRYPLDTTPRRYSSRRRGSHQVRSVFDIPRR